jgi:hypothetical protein
MSRPPSTVDAPARTTTDTTAILLRPDGMGGHQRCNQRHQRSCKKIPIYHVHVLRQGCSGGKRRTNGGDEVKEEEIYTTMIYTRID